MSIKSSPSKKQKSNQVNQLSLPYLYLPLNPNMISRRHKRSARSPPKPTSSTRTSSPKQSPQQTTTIPAIKIKRKPGRPRKIKIQNTTLDPSTTYKPRNNQPAPNNPTKTVTPTTMSATRVAPMSHEQLLAQIGTRTTYQHNTSSTPSTASSSSSNFQPSIQPVTASNVAIRQLKGNPIFPNKLKQAVLNRGGIQIVISSRKWQSIRQDLGLPKTSSSK